MIRAATQISAIESVEKKGGNDANQVAFRVFEPSPFASTRHPSDAAFGPRLWGVVLLGLHAGTPYLVDGSAVVGYLEHGLRELPDDLDCVEQLGDSVTSETSDGSENSDSTH
jgi:hypothetical protein